MARDVRGAATGKEGRRSKKYNEFPSGCVVDPVSKTHVMEGRVPSAVEKQHTIATGDGL